MLFIAAPLTLLITLCLGSPIQKRAVPFSSPAAASGSMLTNSSGLGEPLNVIISGMSTSEVLTDEGFLKYAKSLGFSTECFGIHIGAPQTANLGDGNGDLPEIMVLRQDYGNPDYGTCIESAIGGDHFRYWRQNGSTADTSALFLAVSHEESADENHTIEPDGYDKGRDELVASAVNSMTSFDGITYSTVSEPVTGLLPVGSAGINHGIAIDGVVKLLTVTIQ